MNPGVTVGVFILVSISLETRTCLDDLSERLRALGQREQPDVATAAMVEAQATHLLGVVEATRRECNGNRRHPMGLAPAIRTLYGLVAGLETATLWHSPPRFERARGDEVELQADHDYQRDGNAMTSAFERAWVGECVQSHRRDIQALTFSSGMAARTTVLAMVKGLAGSHCSGSIVIPAVLSQLDAEAPQTTLVIDTTLLSQSCQPLLRACRVRVLVVESLTKWSQLNPCGVDQPRPRPALRPGSSRTRDRPDRSYWLVQVGLRFSMKLAMPSCPSALVTPAAITAPA